MHNSFKAGELQVKQYNSDIDILMPPPQKKGEHFDRFITAFKFID